MKWLFWRWRVAREFTRQSDMGFVEAWKYSDCMEDFFRGQLATDGPTDPDEAVRIEMSYWDEN